MKTHLKNFALTALGEVQPRATMASFGYVLWMLVLLLGGGMFEVKAATDCTVVTEIPKAECDALVALYDNTNGAAWSDSPGNQWKITNTPCSWAGITCSAGGPPKNVTSIDLSENQLKGTIPNLDLPALQTLYLDANQLSGPLPDFDKLTALLWLVLDSNQLSGSIPNFNLPNLQLLSLSANQLSGTIPNFNLLPALQTLELGFNQLSGSLPNVKPPKLQALSLYSNQLSGEIPTWLTTIPSLNLDDNYLIASSSVKEFLDKNYSGWQDRQNPPFKLTLQLSDNLLLKNGSTEVTGTLSPVLSTINTSVANREITLIITPSNNQPAPTTRTDSAGNFTVSVKDPFTQTGKYTLQAVAKETVANNSASSVQTLTVEEKSGITLSEIIFPPKDTGFDQLPVIAGKATDNQQGKWINKVELTLQDPNSQYLSLNSNTPPSATRIPITAEGKTEWFVNTNQMTLAPGNYLITALAVDTAGVSSNEVTRQFNIGLKMSTTLTLDVPKNTLSQPGDTMKVTGKFSYTYISPLPTPDLSTLVIRWELKTPDGRTISEETKPQADGQFEFTPPTSAFDKIGGYQLQAIFNGNDTLRAAVSNSENITKASGTLEILQPTNDSTVKTLPWISGQTYAPNIKQVNIAVKNDQTGKYLQFDNLGGRFVPVKNDQPIWIPATGLSPWQVNISKVILIDRQKYTITAQAFDKIVDVTPDGKLIGEPKPIAETPPTSFTFSLDKDAQAFTSLAVKLQSPTLLIGEPLNLTGRLERYPYEGQDLKGKHLEVTIESPDGKVTTKEVDTFSYAGDFELRDLSEFNQEGTYRINASFAGDAVLAPAVSEPQRLLVGQTAGYAILIQGKTLDDTEGLKTHIKTVKRIYQQLQDRGLNDNNIYYFGYDPNKPSGVDQAPSKAGIDQVFNDLKDRLNKVPAPVYVILVDHGGVGGKFYLNGTEEITPKDLDGWLQPLEDGLTNELAKQQPRVVVLGACYSGSFIRPLSKNGRIIITSVAENEVSYKGPVEPIDGIRTGELFIQELFDALGRDLSFAKAFEKATETLRVYTRSGTPVSNNTPRRFFDDAVQHPLLDDNGDKIGSNVLNYDKDGRKAAEVYLGVNRVSQTRMTADILGVPTPVVYLSPQDKTFKPSLEVINAGRIKIATVDIRGPNEAPLTKEGKERTDQAQIKQLPRIFLSCNKGVPLGISSECYTATQSLSQFDAPGKYDIFYFVNDIDPDYVSPLWHSVVYKAKEGNKPPQSVKLQKPANEGKAQTTLLFDWENAIDTDPGDSISYILLVAQDPEFKQLVYQQDGIRFSQSYIDSKTKVNVWDKNALATVQFGLKDQTTYYWKVIAMDNYGAQSEASEVFKFTTDNPNAPPGCGSITPDDALGYSGNPVVQECIDPMIPQDVPPQPIPGQVGFSADSSTINEGYNEIILQVDRVDGNQGQVTVDYNYTLPDGKVVNDQLVWEDGVTDSQPIVIIFFNNNIVTGNRTGQRNFPVTLSNPTGGATLTLDKQTVTINKVDLRPGIIQFGTPSVEANDDSGSAKLTVERADGTGTDGKVSVNWVASSNELQINQGVVTWTHGDGADKEIPLPISNTQADQLIQVKLGTPTGNAQLGEPQDANVVIKHVGVVVPAGTLQFAPPTSLEIQEGQAPLIINVNRDNGTTGEVKVEYRLITENSTAQLDKDFRLEGTSPLFWPAGDATSKQITLVPYNEGETEEDETVTLQLFNATGGANLGTDKVTVTIKDGLETCDDKVPTKIQFAPLTPPQVSENIGPVTFTVTRTGCVGEASVEYEVTPDSTATHGLDYTGATTGKLTWADKDKQPKTFTLTIVKDTLPEPEEKIELRLKGENLGEPQTVSLIVADPPTDTVQFVSPPSEVKESDGTVTFTVTCATSNNDPCQKGSVDYSVSPTSTATSNGDYRIMNAVGTLTWQAGDPATKSITVTLINDVIPEPPETLVLTLTNARDGITLGPQSSATVTIRDDDGPFVQPEYPAVVQFAQPEYHVTEGEVEYIDILVTITGPDNSPVGEADVLCNFNNGQLPTHLIWLANETIAKNCGRIQIKNDKVITGNREIIFSLSNAGLRTQIGEPATTKLVITEDDKPCTPHFTTKEVTVTEADKEVELTVECTGGAEGSPVTTDYQTDNGTALAGEDYQSPQDTLTFSQDKTSDTVKIPLIDDDRKEEDKQLVVKLSPPPPDDGQVTITIQDDDVALPTLGCMATDNTGKPFDLAPETTRCQGGISVAGGDFINNTIITRNQEVSINGQMTIDPQHVGKDAELVLFVGYTSPGLARDQEVFLMLDTATQILPWSSNLTDLVAWQTAKPLEKTLIATLYQGPLNYPGRLTIFFGYRLTADGMVVQNKQPIEVQIDE